MGRRRRERNEGGNVFFLFIKKQEKSVGRRRKGKASIVSKQQNVSETMSSTQGKQSGNGVQLISMGSRKCVPLPTFEFAQNSTCVSAFRAWRVGLGVAKETHRRQSWRPSM